MASILAFGPFRLETKAAILFCDGEPVMLGQRAVALLQVLLDRAGAPVDRAALMDAAWPGLTVEDSNLAVQISRVRRALRQTPGGERWIETLPRRGYRYVGPPVTTGEVASPPQTPTKASDRPSIAVLPFANLSDDPAQQYFIDGMVDDVIDGLSRIKWLFVIARSTMFSDRHRAMDSKAIGRELGVRYLLDGSVRTSRDRLRIAVRLVNAESGEHVWAERYDRRLQDVFALQDDIAVAVVGVIEPTLRRAEAERVRHQRTDSLDAYDLVLRSQPDMDCGMPAEVTRALALLERALVLDPTYARAHAYAAMCHHCLFLRAGLKDTDLTASLHYARAAIMHGQDDPLALALAGFSIGMDGHDRTAAVTAFEAALAISPSSALSYILGSVIEGWAGSAERAIAWAERGLHLSPFDSWAFAALHALTLAHFRQDRFDTAARFAYRAVQVNPSHSISHMLLAAVLVRLGRLDEGRASAARVLQLQPNFHFARQFAGVDCAAALAASLGQALRAAGLPQ